MTMQEIRNKKFWDCGQRDQLARSIIFQYFAFTTMNIWPILIKKLPKQIQNVTKYQSTLKIQPNTYEMLLKWQNLVKSGHCGIVGRTALTTSVARFGKILTLWPFLWVQVYCMRQTLNLISRILMLLCQFLLL